MILSPLLLHRELLAPGQVPLKEGNLLRRKDYAETLRQVSQHGADYFYKSSFTEELVSELRAEYGSIITVEDLNSYSAIEREAVVTGFGGYTVCGVPTPAGGHVLALLLRILESMFLAVLLHKPHAVCVCRVQLHGC